MINGFHFGGTSNFTYVMKQKAAFIIGLIKHQIKLKPT